jgi:D-erythro-7,8-dihydroneopterin triphosphate epimerase
MDRILIHDLLVRCIIGVNDDERREKQDVVINLELSTDLSGAGASDRFEDALDYRGVKKQVVAMAENSRFFLIEALAEAVARICLAHAAVVEARVRVEKPSALRFARSVGVELVRTRKA